MIFLDSSYIIGLIFENDKNHIKAMKLKYLLEDEAKIINNTVLNEVLNSLNRKNEKLDVDYIINELFKINKIDYLSPEDYLKSIKIFNYYNQSINFSDCTILKSMTKNNISNIITFDSDFEKIKGITTLTF